MRRGIAARKGSSALLSELGRTYALSKWPCSSRPSVRRARSCSPPCWKGNSITASTCGIARYTGATQGSAPTVSRSPRARRRRSSGSVITASPIHCGAMTRLRASVVGAEMLAFTQLIDRAAVRALGRAALRDVQVHARMGVPELHVRLGAGTEDAAIGIEVPGDEFDDRFLFRGGAHLRLWRASGRTSDCGR